MQNETGRSLLEILGVLAIIGVLSVGGIAGFKNAMEKNRANTIISEAQKRAVVVAGQIGFNNGTPSLADFSAHNTVSGGTFGDVVTTGLTGQFGIPVSGVSQKVCQNILNTLDDKTSIRRLSLSSNPTVPMVGCEDSNDFLIVYNNDMKSGESDTEYATDESSCKTVCGAFNPNTHLCEESDCEVPEGGCTENDDCNSENECMICDTEINICKNGCERVEYLESTGSQYIDTGWLAKNTSKVFISIQIGNVYVNNDSKLFGSVDDEKVGICLNIFKGNYRDTGVPVVSSKTDIQITRTSSTSSSASISYDGKTYNPARFWHSNPANIDVFPIFAGTDTQPNATTSINKSAYKCYSFKQYNLESILVRDFTPVISPEGEPCMFDKVSQKLFCNAGSGTFKTNLDE